MKRISLTKKEIDILEQATINYGAVVTFDQLAGLFDSSREYARKRIHFLAKSGWLFRVKRGLYVLSDLSSRGSLSIDPRALVNHLVGDAYISTHMALQFHGMFDQHLGIITSISLKQYKSMKADSVTLRFIKTREYYFYGWHEYVIDGQPVRIASAEKALVDLIQYHRTNLAVDLVLEKLKDYASDLDFTRLVDCTLRANLTTRRIMGFLLDCLNRDTETLLESVKEGKSVSCISGKKDVLYNSKWKVYYDEYFGKYIRQQIDPPQA